VTVAVAAAIFCLLGVLSWLARAREEDLGGDIYSEPKRPQEDHGQHQRS
jgi:hypothetical protein